MVCLCGTCPTFGRNGSGFEIPRSAIGCHSRSGSLLWHVPLADPLRILRPRPDRPILCSLLPKGDVHRRKQVPVCFDHVRISGENQVGTQSAWSAPQYNVASRILHRGTPFGSPEDHAAHFKVAQLRCAFVLPPRKLVSAVRRRPDQTTRKTWTAERSTKDLLRGAT